MVKKFKQYDSVQITTFYSDGKVTYRRGLLAKVKYDGKKYTFVPTVNSTFSKFTYGIEIVPPKSNKKMKYRNYKKVKITLFPCRIVLLEKLPLKVIRLFWI